MARVTPTLPQILFTLCLILATQLTPTLTQRHPTYNEQLSRAATLINAAKQGEATSFATAELKEKWPLLFSPTLFQHELLKVVQQLSNNASFIQELSATPNMSAICSQHVVELIMSLTEGGGINIWKMIDSMGKPSPDLSLFNFQWVGSLKECTNVTFMNSSAPSQRLFSGEYCTANIPVAKQTAANPLGFQMSVGICVPDSCSDKDISNLMTTVFNVLQIRLPKDPFAVCQDPNGRPLDRLAIAAIVVVSIFVALMVIGTVVDIVYKQLPHWRVEKVDSLTNNYSNGILRNDDDDVMLLGSPVSAKVPEPGFVGKLLIAFSVYTNGAKLLSTEQTAGTLGCVHGIRFLSMTWVVLGHTYLVPLSNATNLLGYLLVAVKRWTFQTIINASVSVDTFFVLSGLLVAYLSLKELKRNGGSLNWFKFYFHRFWRLTPPYMLIIFVYLSLNWYWGSGPVWPSVNPDSENCKTSWWTNLLYINNFVDTDKVCLAQSWYLANDMQFYILSPLIFVPLYYSPLFGTVAALVFLLATTITPAALTMKDHFGPGSTATVDAVPTGANYMSDYYIKPYNRMGPYIMGMVTGYLLYRTDCKVKLNQIVNLVCWGVATATALAVLYGLYHSSQGHPMALSVSAFYNAVARTAWGASVAWVIFACVTGNGGFVNTILSWKALIPLSRLTYVMYLLHIMVLTSYVYSRDTTVYVTDANVVMLFLALLVFCYMISAVVSLAFEAPMMALEKVILGHRRNN